MPPYRSMTRVFAVVGLSGVAMLLAGCAQPYSGNCTQQSTVTTGQLTGGGNYRLAPAGATQFSMYPGQQVVVPVEVQPVDNSTGTVTLTAQGMPSGLTMNPVTAKIGDTANLTFTSTTALGAECFRSVAQLFTATATLDLHGESSSGRKDYGMDLDLVLTNPAFTPTKTTLPVVAIQTANSAPIASEDDYVTGSMTIQSSTSSSNYSGALQIKGHGHSTWLMPKQPYRLKLNSKSKLLGMPSEKNWILLANYDDKTMLRDALASQIANIAGMPWAPRSQFVELMLNGQYQGTYQLIESVDIDSDRVNIAASDTNAANVDANGYVMEIDQHLGEDFYFISNAGLYIGSVDPDPPTADEQTYLVTNLNAAERSFFRADAPSTTTGWRTKWNEASVIDWFLVNELMGNHDSAAVSSDYLYKDAGDAPWFMGPIWDFDVSSGNDNYGSIQNPNLPWVRKYHPWYEQLFVDKTFQADVKARWTAIRPQIDTLPAYIDSQAAALAQPAGNNYARWPTLSQRVWPNVVAQGTYQAEVDYLKQWLSQRVAYMDANYLN